MPNNQLINDLDTDNIPLLVYDHFSPVASQTQAAYCIVMVVVALLLTFWITKRWEGGLSINKYIC